MNDLFEQIGEIANDANDVITYKDLAAMLYVENRGIAPKIRAAYNYFYRRNQHEMAENIANRFVNEEGKNAYYEQIVS